MCLTASQDLLLWFFEKVQNVIKGWCNKGYMLLIKHIKIATKIATFSIFSNISVVLEIIMHPKTTGDLCTEVRGLQVHLPYKDITDKISLISQLFPIVIN